MVTAKLLRPAMRTIFGFNLIELLVAITILGILSAISVPIYSVYTQRAKIAQALAYGEVLKQAYSDYYMSNGTNPADMTSMGLTTITTDVIAAINYYPGNSTIGELSIRLNMTEIGVSNPPCDNVEYWLRPTYTNKMLTWECRGYVSANSSCVDLLRKISPPKCYEHI